MLKTSDSPRWIWDEIARRASYTIGLVGGLIGILIGPPHGSSRHLRRQLAGGPNDSLLARAGGLPALRAALVRSTKDEVVATIGAPPAAAVGLGSPGRSSAAVAPHSVALLRADTWYYPFDPSRQSAVAIRFYRGRVVHVEFIGGLVVG